MYVLVVLAGLCGFPDCSQSIAQMSEVTERPLLGTWRVLDIIDGPVSSRDGKTVQITDNQPVITGGVEKEEYSIVSIIPTQRPAAIDLRVHGRTYRGIYQQEGKRLRLYAQFWTAGNAISSVRPESYQEADRANVFGPTLYVLEFELK
jgi:hypothetical protein